ncbi:MAG TPA: di-heme oxidoredictase family protein [Alphaproteobacteria bacterium]
MGLRAGCAGAIVALVLAAWTAAAAESADPAALSGGPDATVFRAGRDAFSAPMPVLDGERLRSFDAGRRLFRTVWRPAAVSADSSAVGLGPLFNRNACSGCHVRDGRGRPPEHDGAPARGLVARLAPAGADYGVQLQDQAVVGVAYEGRLALRYDEVEGRFADGGTFSLRAPRAGIDRPAYGPVDGLAVSLRVPPAVAGVGLLEAVDEAALRALADPDDADGDGISGRLAEITRAGRREIGRFGWKATRARLADQVAAAAADDIGLASAARPDGGCAPAQVAGLAACRQEVEIDDAQIGALVAYLRGLAVPARRDLDAPAVVGGEALFAAAGCPACHVPVLPLASGAAIRPYTDLLLHDLGEGLADEAGEGAATGAEWRTAPLWGIGLVEVVNGHSFFLHDGRARSLIEAVLWHGGEAAAARDAVLALSADDRAALVAFLGSL